MDRRAILKYVSVWVADAALPRTTRLWASATPGIVGNQAGYLRTRSKAATLQCNSGDDPSFQVFSELTGQSVLTGKLTPPITDTASGDRVAYADFSQVTDPGMYRVVAAGGRGDPFSIGDDVYRDARRLAIRAFYGQRCGCVVNLGDGYQHPACHTVGAFHQTSGRNGALPNTGGWHDAGDYGRYIVNCSITSGTLLSAWELYPRPLRSLSLDIPESGGKLPDYLAEVQWSLEWMLSLQDTDGGVWHKQTSEQFCGFISPEQDKLTSYVIGTGARPYKSTCATAGFAAVMAIAARTYSAGDPLFAARCLAAAKAGWTWAVAHPDVVFNNPPGIATGGYGDAQCSDELLWASAELWRTTGEREYERAFLESSKALPPETTIVAPSWSNVAPLAYWTYALAERKGDARMRGRIIAQTQIAAAALVTRWRSSGYGNTLAAEDYVWGSNAVAANQSLLLFFASQLTPSPQTEEAALGNLHYLLGRNCFGVSWVTQVGTNPFLHPHHRPSVASSLAAPWPGLLSGGPNARPADKVAQKLPPMPPMRMWVDHSMAYSVNEVAINWNAPLVFLLAAAS